MGLYMITRARLTSRVSCGSSSSSSSKAGLCHRSGCRTPHKGWDVKDYASQHRCHLGASGKRNQPRDRRNRLALSLTIHFGVRAGTNDQKEFQGPRIQGRKRFSPLRPRSKGPGWGCIQVHSLLSPPPSVLLSM
jgi:hypothetical protein